MRLVKIAALVVALPLAVACGGDDGGGTDPPDQGEVDPAGTHNTFVVDSISVPTSVSEAQMFGLDLDGDELGRPDNALGNILSALASAGGGDVDLQAQIDEAVAFGDIILLTSVQATNLGTATGVGLWVFLGDNENPTACVDVNDMTCGRHLDGNGAFDVGADSPTDAVVVGQNIGGKFTGGPGTVTLELSLLDGTDPVILNLIGARAEVNVTATTLTNGKLGGAITDEDLRTTVLPAIADLVQQTVAEDCMGTVPNCCAEEGSTGETLLGLFDESPEDCMVSLTEIEESSIISSLLAPDLDLFDCPSDGAPISSCTFNPNQDEFNDSLSLGLGFSATTGTYTLPPGI
jgi:hypothetical protein